MEYYQLLNLSKEPFSNSPNPELLYPSREHVGCLQKLELSIRLRRGLNVVVGDIGTGKTTLCRQLIRRFASDDNLETHLILDPDFRTSEEAFFALAAQFGLSAETQSEESSRQIKEKVQNYLFQKGVEENKTVVLIVDEGQKMPEFCLEILRELLNYETNEYKLLQIVIFAQSEFHQTLSKYPNFADRINFYHVLAPLGFFETRNLIKFRLNQAKEGYKKPKLFTGPGIWAVYRATRGYPRRIIHLCHRVLMTMIIQNRTRAGWSMVRWCSKMLFPAVPLRKRWATLLLIGGLLMLLVASGFAFVQFKTAFFSDVTAKMKPALAHQENPSSQAAAETSRNPAVLPPVEPERIPGESATSDLQQLEPQNTTGLAGPTIATPAEEAVAPIALASLGSPTTLTHEPEKPVETGPAVPSPLVADRQPPEWLGEVTIRSGDQVEPMIKKIYGRMDHQALKAVVQSNPQITDINSLDVGERIRFPSVSVEHTDLPENGQRVVLAERDTLDDAYQLLRTYPRGAPPVRLHPFRDPRGGYKFAVLFKDCCADRKSAESALARLPQTLASGARIGNNDNEGGMFSGR
jgi:general secretion pathway protein A